MSLPTQPAALLAEVHKTIDAVHARRLAEWSKPMPEGLPERTRKKYALMKKMKPVPPTPEERNARAFELIALYMRDAVLPRKIEAGLYGAMAKIPGVRYEAKATDIAGRPGVTLSRMENGHLRSEIFIDPKTYDYMGFRVITIKKGEIVGWGGMIKSGFVAKPGQRT
jgi:hypothetical protein